MIRILYTICMAGLIVSTTWAASSLKSERPEAGRGVGIVLLAALQR